MTEDNIHRIFGAEKSHELANHWDVFRAQFESKIKQSFNKSGIQPNWLLIFSTKEKDGKACLEISILGSISESNSNFLQSIRDAIGALKNPSVEAIFNKDMTGGRVTIEAKNFSAIVDAMNKALLDKNGLRTDYPASLKAAERWADVAGRSGGGISR